MALKVLFPVPPPERRGQSLQNIQDLMKHEGRTFHKMYWAPLMQIQGVVADVKFDLIHYNGHFIPMMLSAISCEHSAGIFHEMTLFNATDNLRYARELLNARMLAERHLAKHLKDQRVLDMTQDKLRITYAAVEDRALFAEQLIGIVSHDNAELRSVGLGLFIVREIVRAHYGEVTVTSTLTTGTTFTAIFPRPIN